MPTTRSTPKPSLRKLFIATSVLLVGLALATLAQAQTQSPSTMWPTKPVRIVVTFPPGGAPDTLARILADKWGQSLGQTFTVDNKPGAGGNIGADFVAKSPPDGTALVIGTVGTHAINAALYDKMPYNNLKDLLAAAREKPGTVNYGSAGIGTGQHMTGALLSRMAGVTMTHVPYRGESAAVTGLLGNEIDFVVVAPTTAVGHVKAGKLRAVANSGAWRWTGLRDVPTIAEQGVPKFEVRSWTALLAPAGTPKSVVDRLNAQVRAALRDPAVRTKLEDATGGEVNVSTPDEMNATIAADLKRWAQLVKDANIQKE